MTGLPTSGKSTLSALLKIKLEQDFGRFVEVLGEDEIRKGLSKDLGMSRADTEEHTRGVTFVAKLLSRKWVMPIVALISLYRTSRAEARDTIGQDKFIEVYIKVSLSTCEEKDPKGLCGRARRREIIDMTEVQDPYGKPLNPDIVVDTEGSSLEDSVVSVVKELPKFGHLAG